MLARFAPALFVMLWSTGFVASKLGAPYAEPFTFLAVRFVIVLALMVPFCLYLRLSWPTGSAIGHALVAGSLLHAGYLGATFWAIDHGMPAGIIALLVSFQPIVTALLAGPFLGERITAAHWAGLAVGLIGIALVLEPKLTQIGTGVDARTLAAACVALATITAGTLYQKRFGGALDLRTATVVQYVSALAICGLLALILEERAITWSLDFAIALAWLVIVLSIGAVGLLLYLIRQNAVSKVTSLFYLVPGVTALIAWALFDEALVVTQIVGLALVSIAVLMIGRTKRI